MKAVNLYLMSKDNEVLERLRTRLKNSLKKRAAKAREDLHYSQADVLAELDRNGLERTQGSLSQIENGTRLPSVEMLYVLARYLNTSCDFLLGLTENALSVADIEEELAAASGHSAIDKIIKGLPPEKQKQALLFAEYLSSQESIERIERNRQANRTLAPLTEQERIFLESRILLASIERTWGVNKREEIEKIFVDKNLLSGGTS